MKLVSAAILGCPFYYDSVDIVECSLVSSEGGPIEWHSGTVISVNAKNKRLTVRATVDGDIQVEKYKFSVTKLFSSNFYE